MHLHAEDLCQNKSRCFSSEFNRSGRLSSYIVILLPVMMTGFILQIRQTQRAADLSESDYTEYTIPHLIVASCLQTNKRRTADSSSCLSVSSCCGFILHYIRSTVCCFGGLRLYSRPMQSEYKINRNFPHQDLPKRKKPWIRSHQNLKTSLRTNRETILFKS